MSFYLSLGDRDLGAAEAADEALRARWYPQWVRTHGAPSGAEIDDPASPYRVARAEAWMAEYEAALRRRAFRVEG